MARRALRGIAASLALALALVAGAAEAQVVGVAAAVRNDVRLRKPSAPLPRPVLVKQRIALGEQVQTGVKSQLQTLLLDKSVFTVGANARVTIDRFVYDPARNSRSMGATVARGAFRFLSGRRGAGSGNAISTPVAAIGIRGTMLDGVVGEAAALIAAEEAAVGRRVASDPETATLVVLRGPGRATEGDAAPGSITVAAGGRTAVADRPMEALYVPRPGAAPIGPFQISAAGLMQIEALLFPAVAERLAWRQPADNLATVPPGRGPLYPSEERARPLPAFPIGGGQPDSGPPVPGLPRLPNLTPPAPQPQAPPPRPQGQTISQPPQSAAPPPTSQPPPQSTAPPPTSQPPPSGQSPNAPPTTGPSPNQPPSGGGPKP